MREVTVKQYAALEQVTPRTVRTWIAKGAVPIRHTPGRQIRILMDDHSASRLLFLTMPANMKS